MPQEQDAALKEALREAEREEKRQATSSRHVDMEYLKNMCVPQRLYIVHTIHPSCVKSGALPAGLSANMCRTHGTVTS